MRRMSLTKLIIIVVMLSASFIFGSKPNGASAEDSSKKEEIAQAASNAWLKLADSGNYGKSWDAAATYFKRAVTKEQWQHSLNVVRKPLGKVLSRTVESRAYHTSLPGAPDGEYVVIQYKTSFENKKNSIETVTPMKDKDDKWRVSGYYIK